MYSITINNQQLPIIIKIRKNSKRMIMRYQPLRKTVNLTMPKSVSIKKALEFVGKNQGFIEQQLLKNTTDNSFADGKIIPVLGQSIIIKYIGGRGVTNLVGDELYIYGQSEFLAKKVKLWLVAKLRAEIIINAENFTKQLNVKTGKITLRDTSSRWGSCASNGNLSFSWRLIFAPLEVMSYVVAHEVAHIKEMNHSQAFWRCVEEICPEWQGARYWLKKHGGSLYGYGS